MDIDNDTVNVRNMAAAWEMNSFEMEAKIAALIEHLNKAAAQPMAAEKRPATILPKTAW